MSIGLGYTTTLLINTIFGDYNRPQVSTITEQYSIMENRLLKRGKTEHCMECMFKTRVGKRKYYCTQRSFASVINKNKVNVKSFKLTCKAVQLNYSHKDNATYSVLFGSVKCPLLRSTNTVLVVLKYSVQKFNLRISCSSQLTSATRLCVYFHSLTDRISEGC